MRRKIYMMLNKIYGVMMFASFFAGILPIIPFIIAIIVGGDWGSNISIFLYKQYYPWVILVGSTAILIGLIAMYFGKLEGLSVKKISTSEGNDTNKENTCKK